MKVQFFTHEAANLVERTFRIGIEACKVVGNGKDVKIAFGVQTAVQDGPAGFSAGKRAACADHFPAVIGKVLYLRDKDIRIGLSVSAKIIDKGLVVGGAELADIGYLLRDGLQETGGNEDVSAFLQHLLYLGDKIGIGGCLARHEHHFVVLRELGIHFHGKARHTQIVLEELFAGSVEHFVGRNAYGSAQFTYEGIGLIQDNIGDASHGGRFSFRHFVVIPAGGAILPGGTEARVQPHVQKLAVVKEHDVAALGNGREEELLGIALHTHENTAGVYPATAITAVRDILIVAHHVVAEVVLKMLSAGRVAGFGPGPYAVKDFGAMLQVKAQALEMVVPVGILNNDLYFGIDGLGRAHHQIGAGFVHKR